MSLQNILVKAYLRLTNYKSKSDLPEDNLPEPPEEIKLTVSFEKLEIDGAKAVWLAKENKAVGAMVYLHGGSYISGAFKEQWQYLGDMCRRTKMAALLIDYRLAPQNPFPAALDDVLVILETLRAIGDLPQNWFLLGDSAGAGLAAATVFRLKEMNEPLPEKMVLMSGWFDLSMSAPDMQKKLRDDLMLSFARMVEAAKSYAGANNVTNPLISPLFGEVKGFPPTLMQIGSADSLLWENQKFYRKCLDAGVRVKYEEYPHAFHDFMMVGFLREAKKARRSQTEFLMRRD